MPIRPVQFLIVLFWLATMGWFGYRDIWPRLRPGNTPPFVIELADEVTSQLPNERTRTPDAVWKVFRNDKEIGKAETRLRYSVEDHSYELESRIVGLKLMGMVQVTEMFNTYRLNERGELIGIGADGRLVVLGYPVEATFTGQVRGNKLERRGVLMLGRTKKGAAADLTVEVPLEPTDAPQGIFLNPLHPVPRVKGLRPGRRWRMPIVNPLADAVEPALRAVQEEALKKFNPGAKPLEIKLPAGPKFLDAEVLTETAEIEFNAGVHECLIVEYRGENEKLRTYVRKSDGVVLKQESEALGERFYMLRY